MKYEVEMLKTFIIIAYTNQKIMKIIIILNVELDPTLSRFFSSAKMANPRIFDQMESDEKLD